MNDEKSNLYKRLLEFEVPATVLDKTFSSEDDSNELIDVFKSLIKDGFTEDEAAKEISKIMLKELDKVNKKDSDGERNLFKQVWFGSLTFIITYYVIWYFDGKPIFPIPSFIQDFIIPFILPILIFGIPWFYEEELASFFNISVDTLNYIGGGVCLIFVVFAFFWDDLPFSEHSKIEKALRTKINSSKIEIVEKLSEHKGKLFWPWKQKIDESYQGKYFDICPELTSRTVFVSTGFTTKPWHIIFKEGEVVSAFIMNNVSAGVSMEYWIKMMLANDDVKCE